MAYNALTCHQLQVLSVDFLLMLLSSKLQQQTRNVKKPAINNH